MSVRNLGVVMPIAKGNHSSLVAYEKLNIVTNNGASYIAKQDVPIGINITDTDYWQVYSERGDSGTTGEEQVWSDVILFDNNYYSFNNNSHIQIGDISFSFDWTNANLGTQTMRLIEANGDNIIFPEIENESIINDSSANLVYNKLTTISGNKYIIKFICVDVPNQKYIVYINDAKDIETRISITNTVNEAVCGGFYINIEFSNEITGFTIGDISITNGTVAQLFSEDNINWKAFIIPDFVGDVAISISSGVVTPSNLASNTLTVLINKELAYIKNNGHVYYDFRDLVSDHNVAITTTDPSLVDISGNGLDLSLINTPLANNLVNTIDVPYHIMTLRGDGSNCVSLSNNGSSFLNGDFSVDFAARFGEGRTATRHHIFGNYDGVNTGLIIQIAGANDAASYSGRLLISYQNFIWLSDSQILPTGNTGIFYFSLHFDFTLNTLKVYVNGLLISGSFTTGNISSTDPSAYSCTADLYLGSYNNNGNAESNSSIFNLFYFSITDIQTDNQRFNISSYLQKRKDTIELVSTLTDSEYLICPHDVVLNSENNIAYISGKGDYILTNKDGSFGILDISNPEDMKLTGGYKAVFDQLDGETVYRYSDSRVFHFVDDYAILFNVKNPQNPTKIKIVANSSGVINGAAVIGNYLFGANKGGFIDVFDISNVDDFTLVGSYDATTDLLGAGPHDIDITDDGEHIVIVSRPSSTYNFAIYKVFNNGNLIPLGSWTYLSRLNDSNLSHVNRVRVISNENIVIVCGDPYFSTINISTLTNPVILDSFNATTFQAGLDNFNNRFGITGWNSGLRIFDISTPANIIQISGYYDDTIFTDGNANFHDMKLFYNKGNMYVIVSAQTGLNPDTSGAIAIFRINRL